MKLDYRIAAKDFLTYQLYTASTSERVQNQRVRNRVIVAVAFGILAMVMIYRQDYITAGLAVLIALSWYRFSPIWERRKYISQYKFYIATTYKERLNKETSLLIEQDALTVKDDGPETVVPANELEEITELPEVILIKINSGASFVLPKDQLDVPALTGYLKEMAPQWNIPYHEKMDWKWK